jgi:hypothetical protein
MVKRELFDQNETIFGKCNYIYKHYNTTVSLTSSSINNIMYENENKSTNMKRTYSDARDHAKKKLLEANDAKFESEYGKPKKESTKKVTEIFLTVSCTNKLL